MSKVTYGFQVSADSLRPHVLADWWAETLGWEVEPSDEAFIRRMIAEGYATEEKDTIVHRGSLVWKEGAAIRHPDGITGAPRVHFQLVPDEKIVKNRMHLDVRVGDGEVEQVLARLIERGATFLYHGRQGPHTWVTMADPEGNEFCVSN
jgi:hypothetical protein